MIEALEIIWIDSDEAEVENWSSDFLMELRNTVQSSSGKLLLVECGREQAEGEDRVRLVPVLWH